MKIIKLTSMKCFSILISLCLLLNANFLYSDITRGCSGAISLKVQNPRVTDLGPDNLIVKTDGRGTCKNKRKANDCRRAASSALFRCYQDLKDKRWANYNAPQQLSTTPQACTSSAISRFEVAPLYLDTNQPNPFDIKLTIEKAACCHIIKPTRTVTLDVIGGSRGDKGCGSTKSNFPRSWYKSASIFENGYEVNCAELRANGICD